MKMLKTKHFRRLAVFLAMIAPAVYLFGSLFSALTGAHGTEVFAEPVYVEEYVPVDNAVDKPFIAQFTVDSLQDFILETPDFNYRCTVEFNGSDYTFIWLIDYDGYRRLQVVTNAVVIQYNYSSETFSVPLGLRFVFKEGDFLAISQIMAPYADLYVLSNVPSGETVTSPGAYSDYVFKNFFAKDNFLVQWGKNAISESPNGFAPFGAFWRYLDVNILHLSNDQMGLMGYGYMYYCCHVLLFDIAFILVTFFLDFIQKVNDKVVGGVD